MLGDRGCHHGGWRQTRLDLVRCEPCILRHLPSRRHLRGADPTQGTFQNHIRRVHSRSQGVDGTKYGAHSPRSFYAHHTAAISMACVRGDAEALVHGASCKETRMTRTG